MKIVIVGAGPTGLGAALRLQELGHEDWELWEATDTPGGLSRSVTDDDGFTWDMGGHVQFSHYQKFDELMVEALGGDGWLEHERESWIRVGDDWVPYPFQHNIHRLPKHDALRCFKGLLALDRSTDTAQFEHFEDLVRGCFGEGIAELFMLPYNHKVWGYPARELSTGWIGDRVAIPDLGRIAESMILGEDNVAWGPNHTFRFPKHGGTGAIWRALAAKLPAEKIHYQRKATEIDADRRVIRSRDGVETHYDALISTIPLDRLVKMTGPDDLREAARELRYSSVHVLGVAIEGRQVADVVDKCWMYFPGDDCPFYRVTVFSNYSPNNVPDIERYGSLMAEVCETPHKPVDAEGLVEETIQGMLNTELIDNRDRIHHVWRRRIERAYPTPTLNRDVALAQILPALDRHGIYSRGRFGAWKYEVSNQDHSVMQGVEAVNHILHHTPEITLWFPHVANAMPSVFGKNWM